MHPILLEIGQFKIHLYGVLIVLGFLIGMPFMVKEGEALGLDRRKLIKVCYWSLISGYIGARLLYVIVTWEQFASSPLKIFNITTGGLVFYGGFIGGVLGFIIFSRIHKLPLLTLLDISAAPLTFNQMLGRFGCFFAGCCWGKSCPTDYIFAVRFHHHESLAPLNIPLHPTQLYEAAFLFVQMFLLHAIYKKRKFEGQVAASYLMIYAIGRFIVEFFRGDEIRGFIGETGFSTSQGLAILMFIAGVGLWVYGQRYRFTKI